MELFDQWRLSKAARSASSSPIRQKGKNTARMEKSEFSVGSRLCEKSNPRSHAVTTRADITHTHAPDVYNPDCGLEKTLTHPFEMSQTIDAVRFPPFTPDRRAIAFGISDRIPPEFFSPH
jgi:hypothetical protein